MLHLKRGEILITMGKKGGIVFRYIADQSVPQLPAQFDDVGLLVKKSAVAPVSGTHTACQ